MTPIYGSNRADLSRWYAYDLPTQEGNRVFWDGGVGKRVGEATGFWNPYNGTIVDAPQKLIDAMPNVCMDGYILGDEVIVTGMPRIQDFVGLVVDAFTEATNYLYDEPGLQANFIDEISRGNDLLKGTPCRMVDVEQLPDDPHASLDYFREKYPNGLARHPYSVWSPFRSVYLVANTPIGRIDGARIREIHHLDGLDMVDFVTVWATVEVEMKVVPLYPGDSEPDCPLWKIKSPLTLFVVEDIVVGYE